MDSLCASLSSLLTIARPKIVFSDTNCVVDFGKCAVDFGGVLCEIRKYGPGAPEAISSHLQNNIQNEDTQLKSETITRLNDSLLHS